MKFIKKYWILLLIAAIAIIALIWYFVSSGKVEDPNKTNTPVPPGSPSPKWLPETFPLNLGMFGTKIKALQTAVGVPADGKLGPQTKAAVIAKGYSIPLSQADYNVIVGTSTTTVQGGTTPKTGEIAYAKYNGVKVYFNSDFSLYKTANKGEYIGTVEGNADDSNYFLISGTAGELNVLKTETVNIPIS